MSMDYHKPPKGRAGEVVLTVVGNANTTFREGIRPVFGSITMPNGEIVRILDRAVFEKAIKSARISK